MTSSTSVNERLKKAADYRSLLSLCVLLVTLLSLVSVTSIQTASATTASSTPDWSSQRMDLDCNGRPLAEVLGEVADFFETTLVYQAVGDELPVWCGYSQLTAREILNRLFQRQNRAILVEEIPERRITVQVFGVSEYKVMSPGGDAEVKIIPFLADMTNKELAAMQNAQLELYRQELKDPDAIIPGLDITRAEVQSLHQEQNLEYEKQLGDQNQIVAGMSLTRQQLNNLHEEQLTQYEDERQNQDVIDPLTGMTSMELKEQHQEQMDRITSE